MWDFHSMGASLGTATTVLGLVSEELVHALIRPSVVTTGDACQRTRVCMRGSRGSFGRNLYTSC
jgi:hypothetical protein